MKPIPYEDTDGWYFDTPEGDIVGPFPTEEEAQEAIEEQVGV